MIQIDKRLLWLQPYIKSIRKIVPLHKLKAIKGYYVYHGNSRQEGQTFIVGNRRKYTITIRLNRENHKPIYIYDCLHTLAHELAHLKYWSHEPRHYEFTLVILKRFIEVFKKEGGKDTYERIKING